MDVGKALRNTSKGRLKYDKFEEERTKEFLDHVSKFSTNVSINTSPKILSYVISIINQEQSKNEEEEKVSDPVPNPQKSDSKCKNSDTFFYELQSETEQPILEYKEEILKSLQDKFKAKKEEYENNSKNIELQTIQQYDLIKRNKELDGKRKAADLKKIEDDVLDEIRQRERLLKDHQQTQAKKLSAIVHEAEMKQKKAEEELRKKEQEQKEFLHQLNNCKMETENSILKSQSKLQACEHSSFLKISIGDRVTQMTKLLDDINAIVETAKTKPLTIEDILNANLFVKKSYETLQDVTNDIEHAKVKALQEHEKKLLESRDVSITLKEKLSNAESVSANQTPVNKSNAEAENMNKVEESNKNKIRNEAMEIISAFMAPDVVEKYHSIMENFKSTTNKVQAFIDDPKNKKFRFELQKI